jgi:hypothetical protein
MTDEFFQFLDLTQRRKDAKTQRKDGLREIAHKVFMKGLKTLILQGAVSSRGFQNFRLTSAGISLP